MYKNIISGIITGFISSLIFNPIDKIIYISTIKNLKLTDKRLWCDLYNGFSINIISNLITSGIYFFYLDYLTITLNNNFQISIITALSCSIILNPLNLIKFNSWYHNYSYKKSCEIIKKSYGYKGFMIGIIPFIIRDTFFNYIYISLKNDDNINNLIVISGALIIVSPLNLIRNMKYISNNSFKSIIINFNYNQLGISKSIIRTIISFYISQIIYNNIKKIL